MASQPARQLAGNPSGKSANHHSDWLYGKLERKPASKMSGQSARWLAGKRASMTASQPTRPLQAIYPVSQPVSHLTNCQAGQPVGQSSSQTDGKPAS
jgi:hypothetical protein